MISLLLIISFLLHLISLYAIYQLYQMNKMQRKQQDTSEIASLFETYLEEIKFENEQLKERLLHQRTEQRVSKQEESKIKNEEKQQEVGVEERNLDMDLPNIDVQDEVEASLESKVLQLHDQDLSPEDIARKLNRGKTEVELIVKLYKKNNSNA